MSKTLEDIYHSVNGDWESQESFKQEILQWVAYEVVGKNESTFGPQNEAGDIDPTDYEIMAMNGLRADQRQILKDHGWKES